MKIRRLFAASLTALFLLLGALGDSAIAQTPVIAFPAPWTQVGTNTSLSVTATTASAALNWPSVIPLPTPPPPIALVCNIGSDTAYVALGNSSVTATTSSFAAPANQCAQLALNGATYVAAIAASGQSTSIVVMTGSGFSIASSGAGSGGGGGNGFPITLGSTSIAANSTTTTLSGLTLASPAVTGSFTATGLVTLADHATQASNTIIGNATSGSASPTALSVGSCSAATNALIWTTNSGFGCNTSITAAAVPASGLTGSTLAPGVTASSLTSVGTLTSLTAGSITDSGFTAGPVVFGGAGGLLSQSPSLTWDPVNLRLGILTATPGMPLDVLGSFNGNILGRFGNTNTGTAALAGVELTNGTISPTYLVLGANYTTSGALVANRGILNIDGGSGSAGGAIGVAGTGPLVFYGNSYVPFAQFSNSGALSLNNTTASTSTTTGAFLVGGGGGFVGSVYAAGYGVGSTAGVTKTCTVLPTVAGGIITAC